VLLSVSPENRRPLNQHYNRSAGLKTPLPPRFKTWV